jgi:hypothetical protein
MPQEHKQSISFGVEKKDPMADKCGLFRITSKQRSIWRQRRDRKKVIILAESREGRREEGTVSEVSSMRIEIRIIALRCERLLLEIGVVLISMLTVSGDCVAFEEAEAVLVFAMKEVLTDLIQDLPLQT